MPYGIIPYIPPPIIGIPDNPPCIITLGACKTHSSVSFPVMDISSTLGSTSIVSALSIQSFIRGQKISLFYSGWSTPSPPPPKKEEAFDTTSTSFQFLFNGFEHSQQSDYINFFNKLRNVETYLHFFFNAFPELLWDGCLCCRHVLYGAFDGNNSIRVHGRHLLNTMISIRIISTKKTHKPKKQR